ncbi:hypothetical protein MNBD_ALPHA02-1470 [hydrothermal vent metagenome]|uniref:Transcriptional regulator, IclR family n=1 Tax=hydrothermal vent metagenome TaxID=652676 RepID=A0A3B0S4N0_9ZZZZ
MHTIRSLRRGLMALEILNSRKTMTVAEMAREISLPRTTTFRILENLVSFGYLKRSDKKGRYSLTIRVRNLASGFNEDAWLSEIVKPLAIELSKIVIWPVSIMSPRNVRMSLRFTTDTESPLSLDYYNEGLRLPILSTATGNVYLAYCSDTEREIVLSALRHEKPDETNMLANSPETVARLIETIRQNGYAINIRSPRAMEPGKTNTIALPIMRSGQFLAALAMRYISVAMSTTELKERYLPTLIEIRDQMEEELAGAGHSL